MSSVLTKLGVVSRREQASCNSKKRKKKGRWRNKVGDGQSQKCDFQTCAAIQTDSGNLAGISGWLPQRNQKGGARTNVA